MTRKVLYVTLFALVVFLSGHLVGSPVEQTTVAQAETLNCFEEENENASECEDNEYMPTGSLSCCGKDKMVVNGNDCWSCWKIATTLGVTGGVATGNAAIGLGVFGFSMLGCVTKC